MKIQKIEKYKIWAADKKNINAHEEYKAKRNEFCKISKQKKCMYNRNLILNAANDLKKMWNCLRNLVTKRNNTQVNREVIFDGVSVSRDQLICDNFNSYFISSIIEINEQIPPSINKYNLIFQTINNNSKFKFKEINVQDICEVAKKLSKKSNKSEYFNSMVLFDSTEYIGFHLKQLINQSLREGKLPENWKISTVIPIPKVKNIKKSNEFRPINTMPPDAKMIENIVKKQLTEYVESNNVLNKFQSAFRKGHSCETTLNNVIQHTRMVKEC